MTTTDPVRLRAIAAQLRHQTDPVCVDPVALAELLESTAAVWPQASSPSTEQWLRTRQLVLDLTQHVTQQLETARRFLEQRPAF